MNLKQINELRADMGLKPLAADPAKLAKARKRDANRSARAQANRDLKAKRNKGGK